MGIAISFVIGFIFGAAALGLLMVYVAADGTQYDTAHQNDDWARH